eukprot:Anaeramoba_ignava/a3_245.p1 GENE.a3_245~~a3_245.p1  ORF type:complete len:235 (+),score=88.30 a3_245:55-759(+)
MSGIDDKEIYCEGWGVKEGHFVKSWQRRFFVLRGYTVLYFSNKPVHATSGNIVGTPKGSFNVYKANIKIIKNKKKKKKANCLKIKLIKGVKYYIAFPSEDEVESWRYIIKRVSKGEKPPKVNEINEHKKQRKMMKHPQMNQPQMMNQQTYQQQQMMYQQPQMMYSNPNQNQMMYSNQNQMMFQNPNQNSNPTQNQMMFQNPNQDQSQNQNQSLYPQMISITPMVPPEDPTEQNN